MKRFYSNNIQGDKALLSGTERDHCIRVLRTAVGEAVEVVNGAGGLSTGRLAGSNKQEAVVELDRPLLTESRKPSVVIATAVPKNPSRWEYFLEKSTELGVDAIVPLICQRSEKSRVRMDRSRQIILSAFKQSRRLFLPELSEPAAFADFVKDRHSMDELFIACLPQLSEGTDESKFLGVIHSSGKSVMVLIGPEGDFTGEEISLALDAGFNPVSLGENRLRVETAALTACTIIKCIDQLS